ncbi:helix-turn-helix transcriptional regulator [Iodobacter sp. CM08]|uniref:helix-turn-helix domain-containing protein n=1 Tax=Iodobacter sp. CM08 TaxID=3085902 RepID=UPI0029819584|nr:helix-turn-helix transcriptional regulator [Iodobacter sp. CM08]MDW5418133.1 helix-turn-helix transcriptional regulator [Iodobacter sp. CM08]
METIGHRLKSERIRLGLSQTAFGAIGGVLKQAQSNYERSERYPDAGYLESLHKVGVDILYIVTGTASCSNVTIGNEGSSIPGGIKPIVVILIDLWKNNKLEPRMIEMLIKLIRGLNK